MTGRFDIAIIGAGSAGLIGADFAATLGAKVALLESHRIGGDCTSRGCVPSKTLIHAAHVRHEVMRGPRYGIETREARADMARVRGWVQHAIGTIYEHTTPEALENRGIRVFRGPTSFADTHTITCGDRKITAAQILICTGARAAVPDITGIHDVPFLTYDTLFDLSELPSHLVILGAGPLGVEMAQAFCRLGARVTIVGPDVLPREEPEVRSLLPLILRRDGIDVVLERAIAARASRDGIALTTPSRSVTGDCLLVAAGRAPRVDGLALDRAGVRHDQHGIRVDKYLRTSVKHIYACGDVIGGAQFSHLAGWQAFHAVRNALLPGRSAGVADVMPAVTFSDPEVARVGPTEMQARERFGSRVEAYLWPMSKSDRAVCDGETDGFIKLVTDRGRTILGATIVASRAGEMIAEMVLAIERGVTVSALAGTIHAYPTWSSAVQLAALDVMSAKLAVSRTGRVVRWLSRVTR
jgi:pyruvate/2-oxoglutarate dehydrogenase complex dihydrolipoamide dehydrogenase (E3) component